MRKSVVDLDLAEIRWADVEALTEQKVAENSQLEFKKALSHPNGGVDGWYDGRDVSRHARMEIANELVAFANAHGGTLVLGIDENRQKPPTATQIVPVPRVHDLAEKMRASIRGLVDPPISSFEVQAVATPDDESEGVILFRVGSSALAPHGVGTPPEAYVRRGTDCAPMTMRDIQSRFWEARTTQERLEGVRQESRRRLQQVLSQIPSSESATTVIFRCSAIPESRLDVGPIVHRSNWLLNLCPGPGELGFVHSAGFRAGDYNGWVPRAHGAFARPYGNAVIWNVTDDGAVSVEGSSNSGDGQHDPGWYSVVALQALIAAGRLRMRSTRIDVAIHIDIEFRIGSNVRPQSFPGVHGVAPLDHASIGPFSWLRRSDLPDLFAALEREVWGSLATARVEARSIDVDDLFDRWERVR